MSIQVTHIGEECFEATNGDFIIRTGSCGCDTKIESNIAPGELFIVSLGMCIGTYLVRFCTRHNLDDSGLMVELEYENSTNQSRVETIDITISLSLDEQYRIPMLRMAKKCYVKQSIQEGVNLNYKINMS